MSRSEERRVFGLLLDAFGDGCEVVADDGTWRIATWNAMVQRRHAAAERAKLAKPIKVRRVTKKDRARLNGGLGT